MASSKGVPLQGDRSAWDDINYGSKHAKSIDDASYEYHTPLSNYNATTAPTATDDGASGYAPGSRWVDVTNDKAYICLDASVGAAVWIEVMKRGDYDEDADGLIDAAHGGTELDSSASNGIPHISAGVWNVLNRLSPGADSELTIATGAITVTQFYHRVDTEADAASDDLDTINGLANDGELLILHPENTARVVIIKHGTGNIYIPGGADLVLNNSSYHVLLIYDAESAKWCVVGGGAGGGGGTGDGDVTGPASSTDNAIARFDGTGGKTIQNSAPTISDDGKVTIPDSASEPPLNVTERSTAPSAPAAGDIYLDDGTNTATGSPGWRRYNGAAWEDVGATGAGGTDAAAIHHNVASEIHSITEKVTPVSADEIIIEDSAASYNKKRVQIGNLPAGGGSGDVVGPSSAVDGNLAVFDGTTGKLLKDGGSLPSLTFYWSTGYPFPTASTRTEDSVGFKFLALADVSILGARCKCDWASGVTYRVTIWEDDGTTVIGYTEITGDGSNATFKDFEFASAITLSLLSEYYITLERMDDNNIKKYYGPNSDHAFMKRTASFSGTPTSQNSADSTYGIMPVGKI